MPKFRLPPLNSLRAFEAAARCQSVKTAAGELHVGRASVSRHIQKLELYVGRKLFNRHPRHVVLTDAGEILLAAVATGFSHIHRAFMLLRGDQYSDRLVISVDPDFAALRRRVFRRWTPKSAAQSSTAKSALRARMLTCCSGRGCFRCAAQS
jgi:DNA-binding transcriptional LysR family regulator